MTADDGLALRAFDVFPKTIAEFRHKTASGGAVSLVCSFLIFVLTISEVWDYMTVRTEEHLFVDTSRGQMMTVKVDITFPALPCSVVHLETQDISGNLIADLGRNFTKTRLDRDGSKLRDKQLPKGNEMIAELAKTASQDHGKAGAELMLWDKGSPFVVGAGENVLLTRLLEQLLPGMFHDEQAIAEMRSHLGEGCHIVGSLMLNKVAGNFHFAVDKNDHTTLMNVYEKREAINMSHIVGKISFGDSYPGLVNPLDGTRKIITSGSGYFQYNMKVVPTIYQYRYGRKVHTNQYSFTEIFRTTSETDKFPAVYFNYELSPIMAKFTQSSRGLGAFLTGLCAIVGGVFTLSGVVDAIIFRLLPHHGRPAGGVGLSSGSADGMTSGVR